MNSPMPSPPADGEQEPDQGRVERLQRVAVQIAPQILDDRLEYARRRRQDEHAAGRAGAPRLPDDEQRDGVEPWRGAPSGIWNSGWMALHGDVAHATPAASAIWPRSSCTLSLKAGVIGHLEVARPRRSRPRCSAMTRPGRALITKMRSARNTASRRSCVTSMMVMLRRVQVADHAPQLLAGEGVERAERFVEHQELRLVDQRAAERRAAACRPTAATETSRQNPSSPTESRAALGLRHVFGLVGAQPAAGAARRSRAAAGGYRASCARAAWSGFWNAMPTIDTGFVTWAGHGDMCRPAGNCSPVDELHQRGLAAARTDRPRQRIRPSRPTGSRP
jgi:hypothetical protein